MVQDIRTEKVFEELDMTSAQSESALWSILGFYFSIIFGLLAVLILLKTVKIGRFLDFSSSEEGSADAVEPASQPGKAAKSPASGRKTKESKYAQPPKSLNGSKDAAPATKAKKAPATKVVSSTSVSPTTLSPVRVGTASVNPIVSKTPASRNKRKPEAPSTGRKKAKKDPDAPKRPLSAYLMFQNDKRAELIQKNPSMTSTEITLLASQMWKEELTEAQKKPYIEKNIVLSEQYKKETAAFHAKKASEPMEVDEIGKSPRRPKDPNAPKRPKTAFLVYNSNAEIRKALKEQFPEASPRDLMRMLGEKWAAMKPEEKEKYEDVAKEEQANYKVEKATYEKKKAAEEGKAEPSNDVTGGSGEPQTDGGLLGFLGNSGVGGYVSSLFGMGSDATKDASEKTPATKERKTKKTPSKKITPTKKTPVTKAKVSPVKKRTPVAKVPILSAARALRSGKRKTRSKTP